MKETGEYGEFLNRNFHALDTTNQQRTYYPTTKQQAMEQGFKWKD